MNHAVSHGTAGRVSHAKHVVLVAILADVTLLARVNVAVLAVESVRTIKAQVRQHESTITLLYGQLDSQSPQAVSHPRPEIRLR
jgi:hypothetical protein